MDLHVLHPNQNDVHQRPKGNHPPQHEGKPVVTLDSRARPKFNLNVVLPESFRVDNLFTFRTGVKSQQQAAETEVMSSLPPLGQCRGAGRPSLLRSCSGYIRAARPAAHCGSVADRR